MLNELSDYDERERQESMGRNDFPEDPYLTNPKSGKNASKLRDMYREFGDAINTNKTRNYQNGQSEVCLHDVLMALRLIGPDTEENLERQVLEGTETTALSTQGVRV